MKTSINFRLRATSPIVWSFFLATIISLDVGAGRGFEGKIVDYQAIARKIVADREFERTHSGRSRTSEALDQMVLSEIRHAVANTNPPRS